MSQRYSSISPPLIFSRREPIAIAISPPISSLLRDLKQRRFLHRTLGGFRRRTPVIPFINRRDTSVAIFALPTSKSAWCAKSCTRRSEIASQHRHPRDPTVIPEKLGIQKKFKLHWIPASVGMIDNWILAGTGMKDECFVSAHAGMRLEKVDARLSARSPAIVWFMKEGPLNHRRSQSVLSFPSHPNCDWVS